MKRILIIFILITLAGKHAFPQYYEQYQIVKDTNKNNGTFAKRVLISGDYTFVGCEHDYYDSLGMDSIFAAGALYIYKKENNQNYLFQKLVAKKRRHAGEFAIDFDISEDFLIVGNPDDKYDSNETNSRFYAGSVLVFKRGQGDKWYYKQKLTPMDRANQDDFGRGVAVKGDNMFITKQIALNAYDITDTLTSKYPSLYVFRKNNKGCWYQYQQIINFAQSKVMHPKDILLEDSFAIVNYIRNMYYEKGDTTNESLHVYKKDVNGKWTYKECILNNKDWIRCNYYNGFLFVGLLHNDSLGYWNLGRVVVYKKDSLNNFKYYQDLEIPDKKNSRFFGSAVSVFEDKALIASLRDSCVYSYFLDNNGKWTYIQKICVNDFTHAWDVCLLDSFAAFGYGSSDLGAVAFLGPCVLDSTLTQCGPTLQSNAKNATFQWLDIDAGNQIIAGDTFSSFTAKKPGHYTVIINKCNKTDTSSAYYVSATQINPIADTNLCHADSILLQSPINGDTYYWSNGSTSKASYFSQPGKYTLRIITDTCIIQDSFNISVSSNYDALFLSTDSILCLGQSIEADQNTPFSSYLWSDGSTDQKIIPDHSGLYALEALKYHCKYTDSIYINIDSLPTDFLPEDTAFCKGDEIEIQSRAGAYDHLWSTASTKQSIKVSKGGMYWLKISDTYCSATDSIMVYERNAPYIYLGRDTFLCEEDGQSITLDAGKHANYLWEPEGQTTREITVSKTGTYYVSVSDPYGCRNSDSINITDGCIYEIYIPNSFSPNGDGINDVFKAYSRSDFENFQLMIFNRWGEKLFESDSIEEGWNGTFKNELCPTGFYYYSLQATSRNDERIKECGKLLLMK